MTSTIQATMEDTRKQFIRSENDRLRSFIDEDHDDRTFMGFSRSYRCDCGHTCKAPQDIFDHAMECKP